MPSTASAAPEFVCPTPTSTPLQPNSAMTKPGSSPPNSQHSPDSGIHSLSGAFEDAQQDELARSATTSAVAAAAAPKWWYSTVSGLAGGVCCVYAGQPFDTIKVRMQTAPAATYRNPIDCLVKTVRNESMCAVYKGSSAALMSIVTENMVLFTANAAIKRAMVSNGFVREDEELSLAQCAIAGGFAGVFSSTAICPAEVLKVRLQTSVAAKGLSPLAVARDVFRTSGPAGFFRGLPSLWMRDIPFNFLFLGSYEAICAGISYAGGKTKDDMNPAELFVSGGLAGMVAWSCVFPVDVIKSRSQSSSGKMPLFRTIATLYQQEGIRTFYRGCSAAVLRAFPANAALLAGFELSYRLLNRFDEVD
ncbi:hypothetical protein H696_00707 [Fonticula alba]|uniref:MC family mitochondrial carrier protein n=1 Tax=Fonticula alba TaxID=691883 RepID=A0A058ZFN2_FONAL|nr:hypothetical protein H696_00707 [Fonticula alba]KCV73164.1 hypothetical protein H696_00707 [Fonticula alba]|eukprot:XP_009492865.1 hypothetical protein H696_00707 [Fonticula alba]